MAKIAETQEKINVLARTKTPPAATYYPPPPPPARQQQARQHSNSIASVSTTASNVMKEPALQPVKKVAPYIPVYRERTSTSGSLNKASNVKSPQKLTQRPAQKSPSRSPPKAAMRRPAPSSQHHSSPQKKQRSASSTSSNNDSENPSLLPLTKQSLDAVGTASDSPSGQKVLPPPPPNLAIFHGAGVVSHH